MGLTIGNHLFYGPFAIDKVTIRKNHHPAVFAVVSRSGEPWNPTFRLLDVGFSGPDGMVATEHPQLSRWREANDGALQIYLYDLESKSSDVAARATAIVDELIALYSPPHGMISIGR
jgi:hypothetical protein